MKGTHGRIAEKADDPAHGASLVIVINLFGFSSATHCTQTVLLANELVYVARTNPVLLHQVIVTTTPTVSASERLSELNPVTGFAVRMETALGGSIPWKLACRFDLVALGTSKLCGCREGRIHESPFRSPSSHFTSELV